MDYSPRIKKLGIALSLLMLLLLTTVIYRMIWQGESLRERTYLDQPMLDLIRELAAEGIIQPAEEHVTVDLERLRTQVPNPATRQYIVERQRYMSFAGELFKIDPAAIRVTNRRLIKEAVSLNRGRILDRSEIVLAETAKSKEGGLFRNYPLSRAGLPLIGVAHPIYGLKGLEKYLSPYLQGETSKSIFNWTYRFLSGKKKIYDAVLTIDSEIQKKAFEALGDHIGGVVVLDVKTGDILAAASTPSFNPATPAGALWDKAAKEGYQGPFINRALQRRYPPGSTFKLVVSAAWMEQEDFDPKWGLMCNGRHSKYKIREYKGKHHGWVSLKTGVTLSCNVFFSEVGARLGPNLNEYANRFGFNRKWPLLTENHKEDIVLPSRAFQEHPKIRSGGPWQPIDFKRNPKLSAQAGVGQNVIEATPLQMAMVGSALGNGGMLMAPRILKQVRYVEESLEATSGLINYKTVKPREVGRVCRKETAEEILSMMADVMHKGTGYRLKKIYFQDGNYKLGYLMPQGCNNVLVGKTGTAETVKGKADHSWFVAVAPLDKPRYAVAVVVEHGGLGGKTAGPIAVDVMLETLNTIKSQ